MVWTNHATERVALRVVGDDQKNEGERENFREARQGWVELIVENCPPLFRVELIANDLRREFGWREEAGDFLAWHRTPQDSDVVEAIDFALESVDWDQIAGYLLTLFGWAMTDEERTE